MRFSLIILMVTGLIACKDAPELGDLVQHMVVQTSKDETTNYEFYKTNNSFTMETDRVGLYANYTNDTVLINNYAAQLATRIKSNMEGAGYVFKTLNNSPDLGIAATVVDNYNVYQQITYPSYYTNYYGYGYGGYYGPIVSTYEYSSSILVINLIDLKNRDSQGRLKVIWKAYIGDLEKSVDPVQKALEAIDQAFEQSPYLKIQ